MFSKKRSGLSLIESLISIVLMSTMLISILGAFFISKLSTARAKHRTAAMNCLNTYIEREVQAGYDGGSDGESDYYITVASADPVAVTIDDRGTTDTSDDLMGTIKADPYYPDNIDDATTGQILKQGNVSYKIVGFVVEWTEDSFLTSAGASCSEKAVTYVAYHS